MLNRDQIAHEYILSGVATTVHSAFQLADAMIAEAQKRQNVESPDIIGDGWIGVDDRLPNSDGLFIVYRPDAHLKPACDRNVRICEYSIRANSFIGSIHTITHWQALPNPPKGASE